MTVKLLAEQNVEFLSFGGGCTGSSESTVVKMPYCLRSHLAAYLSIDTCNKHLYPLLSLFFSDQCSLTEYSLLSIKTNC